MNRLAWRVFSSYTVRTVSLVVVMFLLVGSGYAVWWAFSSPIEVEKQVTALGYTHEGKFDRKVYAKTNQAAEGKSVYFTKLIKSTEATFSYKFLLDSTVTDLTHLVTVSAIIENPGLWQREVILVPESSGRAGGFTIDFPLMVAELQELSTKIGDEIGIRSQSPDITYKASVHTSAYTEFGTLNDDFVQTAKLKVTSTTMEWDKNLAVSRRGSYKGLRYEHQGVFDYTVELGPNSLYDGPVTLTANALPPEPPATLPRGTSYATADMDDMDVVFSYKFKPSKPVKQVSEEVKVTAVLSDPENWSETYVLLPKRVQTGDFTLTFPVDVSYFYGVIKAKQKQMRILTQSHNLILEAEVHTMAPNQFGKVDDVFRQSLKLSLNPNSLGWAQETTKSQSGSILTTSVVPRPEIEVARTWSPVALPLAVLAFLFVMWNYIKVKPTTLPAVETELKQARKRYKGAIVDVQELPETEAAEAVVRVASLEGLVKTADDMLRPVLHRAEGHKHVYCVMDGSRTRYEYISGNSVSSSSSRDENPTFD